VLSRKIKHPRLAQPKLLLERFKNRMNGVPIRPQFAKFFVPHGDIVGGFGNSVKDEVARTLSLLALASFSRYFPPAVAKVYILSFRTNDDRIPSNGRTFAQGRVSRS
jgi:hypothetical protein